MSTTTAPVAGGGTGTTLLGEALEGETGVTLDGEATALETKGELGESRGDGPGLLGGAFDEGGAALGEAATLEKNGPGEGRALEGRAEDGNELTAADEGRALEGNAELGGEARALETSELSARDEGEGEGEARALEVTEDRADDEGEARALEAAGLDGCGLGEITTAGEEGGENVTDETNDAPEGDGRADEGDDEGGQAISAGTSRDQDAPATRVPLRVPAESAVVVPVPSSIAQ